MNTDRVLRGYAGYFSKIGLDKESGFVDAMLEAKPGERTLGYVSLIYDSNFNDALKVSLLKCLVLENPDLAYLIALEKEDPRILGLLSEIEDNLVKSANLERTAERITRGYKAVSGARLPRAVPVDEYEPLRSNPNNKGRPSETEMSSSQEGAYRTFEDVRAGALQ